MIEIPAKWLMCILLALCCLIELPGQTYPYKTYIDTWKLTSPEQTLQAQILSDDLDLHKDSAKYHQLCTNISGYLKKHPNKRINTRFTLYKTLWELIILKYEVGHCLPWLEEAIKEAYILKDRQLNSELYTMYAEVCLRKGQVETSLLYNLKALDIQEEMGIDHFPIISKLYFSVARTLYMMGDYDRSLHYALRSDTEYRRSHFRSANSGDYVFLNDIIGANYEKMNEYDKAIHHYQVIKKTLYLYPAQDPRWQRFWLNMANANIGRVLVSKGKYDEAEPLIWPAIESCFEFEVRLSAAAYYVLLAQIDVYNNSIPAAKEKYHLALSIGKSEEGIEVCKNACQGLFEVYQKLGVIDSAYFYNAEYHRYKYQIEEKYNMNKVKIAQAEVQYEKLQYSLEKSQEELLYEKIIRRSVIAGGILLLVTALIWYKWRRNKYLYRIELEKQQRLYAEKEMMAAQYNVELFKKIIIEKNDMINQMEQYKAELSNAELKNFPEVLSNPKLLTDDDWLEFRKEFATAYPAFFISLYKHIPDLSPAMERLACLIFLKLDNNQIAGALGISKDSVARSKRRLRTSLQIPVFQDLEDFILNMLKSRQ